MAALINNNLANAMDRLERRILSLHYNGYFTNNLFSELKQALQLEVGFRVHPPLNDDPGSVEDIKFHFYGQTEEEADIILEGYKSSLKKEQDSLFEFYKIQEKWKKTPPEICFSAVNYTNQNVKTRLDILLWVKKCTCGAPFFYNLAEARCLKCKKNDLQFVLRGIIRLYSALEESELTKRINTFGRINPEGFGSAVCDLFARQEEPDCFQKPEEIESKRDDFCSICNFNESCHIGFGDITARKDFLDPDEVIHQLQEKCRTIMGLDYQFPILLCDSSKMALRGDQTARILKYRAVDYVEIPEDFQTELSTTILSGIKKNDLIRVAQRYPFGDVSENVKSILLADNKKDFEKFVRCLLKAIVQLTDKGGTNHVWNTWEDRAYPDLKYEVKEDPEDIIREFIEYLLFIREGTGIIITPLGYLGQKLGLMFTMVKNADEEKLKKDQTTFLRIAREFAPLLFHSLEYEMYNLALRQLEKRSLEGVPNILLGILPKLLNIVAGAFWSRKQIEENDKGGAMVPVCLYAFKSNSIFLELQELNREEAQTVWADKFGNACYSAIKENYPSWEKETLMPTVVGVETNGDDSGIEYYGIKVRSRLLLPVPLGKTDAEALPEEVHGVFDLYFERSEFVLHRHALDLTRELGFIFAQTANAAKQKQGIINRGRRAAVSAIMARNMSHNIGSHVLSYWVTILNDMEDIEKSENARLYGYLRERMDFIAEICTMDPTWATNMRFCKDILIPFLSQRILLNNIARSEKVCRDIEEDNGDIPIHFKVTIDNSCALTASWRKKGRTWGFFYSFKDSPQPTDLISKEEIGNKSVANDVTVAIPHGFIGVHAFYSIVENFIRNSAKHGGTKLVAGTPLEVHFKADTRDNPEFVKLVISDNAGSCDYELLQQLSKALNPAQEPLTDYKGELKSGNWGIKEMRISANYLRMRRSEQVDEIETGSLRMYDKQNQDRLIGMDCDFSCTPKDLKCSNPNVRYSFLFMKPRDALIVYPESFAIDTDRISKLSSQGIFFETEENFVSMIAKSMVILHRFLLYISSTDMSSLITKYKEYLPFRIIEKDEINMNDLAADKLYLNWLESNYRLPQEITIISPQPYNISLISDVKTYSGIDPKTTILLDDHGKCFNNSKDLTSLAYYQPYRKDERVVRLLRDIASANGEIQNIKRYEMIEAFLTQIIIADERIWAKMTGTWRYPNIGDVERTEVLRRMKIHLVPVDGKKAEISDIQATFEGLDDKTPVFFIIHQGLIDKMDDTGKEEMEKVVKTNSKNKKLYYIITSGRGKPWPLAPEARFIEISQLESLVEEKDKYGLVQILFSLRRPS